MFPDRDTWAILGVTGGGSAGELTEFQRTGFTLVTAVSLQSGTEDGLDWVGKKAARLDPPNNKIICTNVA
jgi:hypothetical protein